MKTSARFLIAFLWPLLMAAAKPAYGPAHRADDGAASLQTLIARFRAQQIVKPSNSPKETKRQLALLRTLDQEIQLTIQRLETPQAEATASPRATQAPAEKSHPIDHAATAPSTLLIPVAHQNGPEQMAPGPAIYMPTALGAPVRAGCGGSVLYAGQFRSYGQLLILDCGGDMRLVLGGLDRLGVRAGKSVRRGQTIGTMPHDSGPPPRLYVEVRHGDQPVDPRTFFRGAHKSGVD